MEKPTLYNTAKSYIDVITRTEQTRDAEILSRLEEQRVIWHNEHVTRMAYQIVRNSE